MALESSELVVGAVEAVVGGVIAGLISWGGIRATLEFHKEQIGEAKGIAVEALAKADRAITILDERRKG